MGGSGGGASTLDLRVSGTDAGARLSDALERWLSRVLGRPVPRARVRALVASGRVKVDGTVLKAPGRPLRAGQRVQAVVRPDLLRPRAERTDRPFRLTGHALLFQDDALLAVDKPPGLPTHATADRSRPNLVAHVERYLRALGRAPYVGVHQRLDRDTSGVVLFATDARANAGLARAFEERRVEKTYVALVARPVAVRTGPVLLRRPVAASGRRQPSTGRSEAAVGNHAKALKGEGRAAETEVVVREVLADALLVEARPRTGRRHQIRVHLAQAGMPILGDAVYGDAGDRAPRVMLHASRLALVHPLTGEPLVVESPLPEDFASALARLRARGIGDETVSGASHGGTPARHRR
jgi:RluA family pseudouridine synthase